MPFEPKIVFIRDDWNIEPNSTLETWKDPANMVMVSGCIHQHIVEYVRVDDLRKAPIATLKRLRIRNVRLRKLNSAVVNSSRTYRRKH